MFFLPDAFTAKQGAVGALFVERYPREARIIGWVGRIGTIASLAYVVVVLLRG